MKDYFVKKKSIIWVLIVLGNLVLLVCFLRPIGKRIDILSDYKQLMADPKAVERIESDPAINIWDSRPAKKPISIGYASFDFPFGSIDEISEKHGRVFIDNEKIRLVLIFSMVKDFAVDTDSPEKYMPGIIYRGGKPTIRDEAYRRYDIDLWKLWVQTPGYDFDKKIFSLKPKSLPSLFFMDFDDLYIYERLLEVKNSQLWSGEVFLFETDTLRGKIERLDKTEREEGYSACFMIVMGDSEDKIHQLIQVISYTDEIAQEDIKELLSSFTYNMDAIDLNSEDIKPVILEALQKNEYYVPKTTTEME